MSLDAKGGAALALHRFGLGPRAGSIAAIASDPRGALLEEIEKPGAGQIVNADLLTSAQAARLNFAYNQQQQAKRIAARVSAEQQKTTMAVMTPEDTKPDDTAMMTVPGAAEPQPATPPQRNVNREVEARIAAAMNAEIGFIERLVWFWSNHFCVSVDVVLNMAGGYEREAIRPHVLGRFADMLKAVEQHPAMLFFLDNQQSLGPDSRAGRNRNRGLNENLAREIMELHVLGVGGGYTQADVTSLANVITGWTYAGRLGQLGAPGTFVFNANAHQPGAQRVMGKIYGASDVTQGEAVLADLARHPSTAKFIAGKFARHFVADDPPPALVAQLADVFARTDGDLKALALALVDSDDAWKAPLAKMRSPYEFLVASGRLQTQIPNDPGRYLGALNTLGQPLWSPAGPNGFADSNAAWAAPEGIKLRLDISAQIASRLADGVDPRDLLELVAADAASVETRKTIERAESRQQALALLLMSPEFQRR